MASTTTTTTAKKPIPMNLTITSSMPRPTALSVDIPPQYVAVESASPNQKRVHPPSPHRTLSDPFPPHSPRKHISNILEQSVGESPKSAGHTPKSPKNLKFGGEGMSPTASAAGKRKDMVKRRHSHEPRMNVHTECGRHSDDWLFGGFSVAGVVKKFWDKKEWHEITNGEILGGDVRYELFYDDMTWNLGLGNCEVWMIWYPINFCYWTYLQQIYGASKWKECAVVHEKIFWHN